MKMKLAVLAALSLVACNKSTEVEQPSSETPAPAQVAEGKPPAPIATPSDIAPDGVFFLRSSVSIETSDSIIGFKPGQVLKKAADGSYLANGTKLQLRADQVTNSLSAERAILAASAAPRVAPPRATATPAPAPVAAFVPTPTQPAGPAASNPSPSSAYNKTVRQWDPKKGRYVTVHVD